MNLPPNEQRCTAMNKAKVIPKACPQAVLAGPRSVFLFRTMLPPLMGLIFIISLSVGTAHPGVDKTLQENHIMVKIQTATTPTGNIPSLDASQPSRVETFTFGLG